MFHQNDRALWRQFILTQAGVVGIIKACGQCSHHDPRIGIRIKPRGLKALEVWQTDVTPVPSFGCLKYVHVSIDTYSGLLWTIALSGERGLHVCKHLTACFAVMGVPQQIKTDNSPGYTPVPYIMGGGACYRDTPLSTWESYHRRAHQLL